jgi:hypothetical protein
MSGPIARHHLRDAVKDRLYRFVAHLRCKPWFTFECFSLPLRLHILLAPTGRTCRARRQPDGPFRSASGGRSRRGAAGLSSGFAHGSSEVKVGGVREFDMDARTNA